MFEQFPINGRWSRMSRITKLYRKMTLVALFAIVSAVALPFTASAFYEAGFYYNTNNSTLAGGVYTKDPTLVKVQIVDQEASVVNATYTNNVGLYKMGYDDQNNPVWSVGFRYTFGERPATVRVSDDDGVTWTTLVFDGQSFSAYNSEAGNYNAYRIAASESYSSVSAATYRYVQPNDELFRFNPSNDWIDDNTPAISMTAIKFYFGSANVLDFSKISKEDFIVYDTTANTEVELAGVRADQDEHYNADYTSRSFTDSTSTILIKTLEQLNPDHQYVVSLSASAGGDEIKRQPAGIYTLALYLGEMGIQHYSNYDVDVLTFDAKNYHGFKQVRVTDPQQPQTPIVTVPITPPATPASVTSGADGVSLKPGSDSVKTEKGADGKEHTTVSLSGDDLKKAFDALGSNASDKQKVVINVEQQSDGTKVELPAGQLADKAKSNPNLVVSVNTGKGSLDLPLGAIDFDALAKQLGSSLADLKLSINVSAPTADQGKSLGQSAKDQNLNVLNVVSFNVVGEAGGKSQEISNFGGTYVPRTIHVSGVTPGHTPTGVLYNPATGEFQFIPSTFDGKGTIVITAPHASLYAVVELPNVTFSDIKSHWAKSDIEQLASKLLVKGNTAGSFRPDQAINRAEFTALIARALGLELTNGESAFSDVAASSWYATAVNAAVKAGIVTGRTASSFAPNDTISREEMSAMIGRALAFVGQQPNVTAKQAELLSAFTDGGAISAWAQDSVAQMADSGIMKGGADGNFNPQANATRAEAVVTLKRLLTYIKFI